MMVTRNSHYILVLFTKRVKLQYKQVQLNIDHIFYDYSVHVNIHVYGRDTVKKTHDSTRGSFPVLSCYSFEIVFIFFHLMYHYCIGDLKHSVLTFIYKKVLENFKKTL